MATTTADTFEELDSSSDVLGFVRSNRQAADAAEAAVLLGAVTWAEQHPPESIHHAATWTSAAGDTGLLLAGPGAPLVTEFCIPELDLADALDLDTALTQGAEQLKTCGSTDTLDVRQAMTAGEIARHQLALDLTEEQARLINHTRVFPWCTRLARRCDNEHCVPYDQGGTTYSCNIAPLCRRHHRLKTHTTWIYTVLEPGSFLWTSPHGYQFLRDHTSTLDVSHDRRPATSIHPSPNSTARTPPQAAPGGESGTSTGPYRPW